MTITPRKKPLKLSCNYSVESNLQCTHTLTHIRAQTRTFELGISHAAPLSTTIPNTRTSHHVTKNIVPLVPLVPDAIHHPFTGCADFFMGYMQQNQTGMCLGREIWNESLSITVHSVPHKQKCRLFVGKVNRAWAHPIADSTVQLLQNSAVNTSATEHLCRGKSGFYVIERQEQTSCGTNGCMCLTHVRR